MNKLIYTHTYAYVNMFHIYINAYYYKIKNFGCVEVLVTVKGEHGQIEESWENRRQRLELCFQLRLFEQQALEVSFSCFFHPVKESHL